MAFGRRTLRSGSPGGFFYLENEKTKAKVSGYGHGEHIRLRDEDGNVWFGAAEVRDDEIVYRFRDHSGRCMSGLANDAVLVLRDEHGNVWRGFVD
jgi:hypothetical protein